jgi:hypothetical protein
MLKHLQNQKDFLLFTTKTTITVDDFAIGVVEALKAENGKMTKALVDAGKLDGTKAAEKGLYTPVTVVNVVDPVAVEVNVGGTVALDPTVSVELSDGTTVEVDVTWPAVDTSAVGTQTVVGDLEGYSETTSVEVTVVMPALDVESATMPNLKEMVIKFNRAVDEDSIDKANFTVDGTAVAGVALADDDMTVTVTLADTPDQVPASGAEVTVDVGVGVTDADGTALAEAKEATASVIDGTRPFVTGIEVTAEDTFTVTLSEPCEVVPDVIMEDGVYTLDLTDGEAGDSVFTFNVLSPLDPGTYALEISAATDYAGLVMVTDDDQVLVYTVDDTPPALLSGEGTQTEVTLTFDGPLDEDADIEPTDFYHSNLPNQYPATGAEIAGSTVVLTFTANPLPEGSIPVSVKAEAVQDAWKNVLADKSTVNVDIVADVTPPSVTGIERDGDTITVTVNEGLAEDAGQADGATITLLDADDEDVIGAIGGNDAGDTTFEITVPEDAGTYTLSINGLADDSLAGNEQTVAFEETYTIGDEEPVEALDIEGIDGDEDDIIYVDFGDDVEMADLLDPSNYAIAVTSGGAFADLDEDTEIEAVDTTEVKITMPDLAGFTPGESDLRVIRVTDTDGNVSAGLFLEGKIKEATAPTATAAQSESGKVVVSFDGVVSGVNKDSFQITVGGEVYDAGEGIAKIVLGSDEDDDGNAFTTATLTLTGAMTDALEANDATYGVDTSVMLDDVADSMIELVADGATSSRGMATTTDTAIAVADETPAVIVEDGVTYTATTDSTIAIEFSEDLEDTAFVAFDLIVKDGDGDVLTAQNDYTAVEADGVITITLTGVADPSGYTVEIKDSPAYLEDTAGNALSFDKVEEPEEE